MAKRNREELKAVMAEYGLDDKAVGKLLNRAASTVCVWRSLGGVAIPNNELELLKLKLLWRDQQHG